MQPVTVDDVWNALGDAIQAEAAHDLWQHAVAKQPAGPNDRRPTRMVVEALAAATGFRPHKARALPVKQAVSLLLKHIDHPRVSDGKPNFITEWLMSRHLSMVVDFLDAAGIPHTRGVLLDDPHVADLDHLRKGLQCVRSYKNRKALGAYLAYCLGNLFHVMPDLPQAVDAESLDPRVLLGIVDLDHDESPASAEPVATSEPPPEGRGTISLDWMTSIDRLIIREVVATALGQERARDADGLLELVEEFVQLNTERIPSFYHMGFAHSLLGRQLRLQFPGQNETRRLWYLAGAVAGLLRLGDSSRLEPVLKSHSALVTTLAHCDLPCATELLPAVAPVLVELRSYDLLRLWTLAQTPRLPGLTARTFARSMLITGERLLREDRAVEARAILETIMTLLHGEHRIEGNAARAIRLQSMRRLAQIHQRAREFDRAHDLLEQVVTEGSDSHAAKALGDLGIIRASFARLEDAVPRQQEAQNVGLIAGLERGRTHFEHAVKRDPEHAVKGHFCLGMLHLFGPATDSRKAAEHFGRAGAAMLTHADAYGHTGLITSCDFLQAIALLETMDEGLAGDAATCLDRTMASGRQFPGYLWLRAVTAASLLADHSVAERLCKHMLDGSNTDVHRIIASSDLHLRSPSIRAAYLAWLGSPKSSVKERWEQGLKMLPIALQEREHDIASEILDTLDVAARADEHRRSLLLQHLGDVDFHSPAWSDEDAAECRVQLLECDGNLPGAVELLRKRFYVWRAAGTPLARRRALLLLERMKDLQAADDDLAALRAQIEQPAAVAVQSTPRDIGILYVGGNETQAQYENAIKAHFGRSHRSVKLRFLFPGWTSNWNDWLEKFKNLLPATDAVVLNSLVRTQFGRHVRKLCDEKRPWFPCGGRGRQSIERSITQAIQFVLDRDDA